MNAVESRINEASDSSIPLRSSKLLAFLEFDGIPWNNNNAEHAVKAFGRGIRDIVDGRTSENGINEYLVLLSINQTCEYRGIDFLKFLRSGETQIRPYVS